MNKFTEKDLAYITDMFSWNMNAFKLANHFKEEVEDANMKEILEEIASMHYDHLNTCIEILNKQEVEDDYEDVEDEEDDENE